MRGGPAARRKRRLQHARVEPRGDVVDLGEGEVPQAAPVYILQQGGSCGKQSQQVVACSARIPGLD